MDLQVIVPPTYPEGFEVLFVGEAPGEDECNWHTCPTCNYSSLALFCKKCNVATISTPEGFVGKSGQLLSKIVFASGLEWSKIAKSNVVKRPPDEGYDSESFQKTFYETIREGRKKVIKRTAELESWIELLKDELATHKPKVIVACGAEALQALTGSKGITKYRGSILACSLAPYIPVVPIIHPAAILRSAQWQELYISSEIISRKVISLLQRQDDWYTPWQETTAPLLEDWLDYVKKVNGPFTLDIETRAGSIACFAVCYNDNGIDRAICVPIQTTRGPYWQTEEDEYEVWNSLQYLMDNFPVINHNIFYDLDWLEEYDVIPRDVHDTMLLFHRYYPELPKKLAFVNMWFNDIPYYKDDGSTWGYAQPDEKLWHYNIKDAVSTLRAWRELVVLGEDIFKHERRLYDEHTRPLLPIAYEMQQMGMVAEQPEVNFAKGVLEAEFDKIRQKLEIVSDGQLVIKLGNKKITDQQVMKYLYSELELPPIKNRKTKKPTADEDALVELLIKFPKLEVLQAINAERKFGKALSSYINIDWKQE